MKKLNSTLLLLLSNLRKERSSPFLFLPQRLDFRALCIAVYYEVSRHEKRDMYLIDLVLEELTKRGILNKYPVLYRSYDLETITIHDVFLTTSDNLIFSRGTSTDICEAYAKALGEVFERTGIRYNVDTRTELGNEKDLQEKGKLVVGVGMFPQPTEAQKQKFKDAVVTKDDSFSWVPIKNYNDGMTWYIPAQTVFLNTPEGTHEQNILFPSSHGAGAGYSKEQAIASGVHEIINRHFFLESWYMKVIPNTIDTKTIPKNSKAHTLIQNLQQRGFTINLLDYSEKAGIPSVICILERYGGWFCGGGAGTSLEKVIERALTEAFSVYSWCIHKTIVGENTHNARSMELLQNGFLDTEFGDARSRLLLYGYSYFINNHLRFTPFIKGREIPFSTQWDKDDTYDCKKHAHDLLGDVFVYEIQKEYIQLYEYHVVKVVIPSSYFFSLQESGSRPVRGGTYPQNTEINPFP